MRQIHSEQQPFHCATCQAAFKTYAELLMHKRTHTARKHACTQCGRMFLTREKAKRHQRSAHEDVRPFICEHCEAAFSERSNLLRHVQAKHSIAAGKQLFWCYKCQRSYKSAVTLRNHTKYIHGDGNSRVKCDQCAFASIYAGALKSHKLNKHSDNNKSVKQSNLAVIFARNCWRLHSQISPSTWNTWSLQRRLLPANIVHPDSHRRICSHNTWTVCTVKSDR